MKKLLAIASLGYRAYDARLCKRRILTGIMMVAGFALATAVMTSAMLVGGFYAAYFALVNDGVAPHVAVIVVGIAAILITMLLATLTLLCLHRLRYLPQSLVKRTSLTGRVIDTLAAFSEGFMAGR